MQYVDFETAPAVGTMLQVDDQTYELAEIRDYRRGDGILSKLLVWHTRCPTCGAAFEATTGLRTESLPRRCIDHRKGARPVNGRRGGKVTVGVIHA